MLFYPQVLMLGQFFSSKFIFFMFLHGGVSHSLQYKVKEKYLKFRNLRVGRERLVRNINLFLIFSDAFD